MTQSHNLDTTSNDYFAAIDLGSRNCRLLISKRSTTSSNGAFETSLHNIEATSRFVCLGEHLTKTNKLSDAAMERALETLKAFQKRISHYDNVQMLAVTTAATRMAKNSNTFLRQIKKKLDLELKVISSEEEALYATLGCAELVNKKYKKAIIFDIGGGSTEVILADFTDHDTPHITTSISIPMGVVSLAEDQDHTTFKTYSKTVEDILSYTEPFCKEHGIIDLIAQDQVQLIGTSGTITTVSALHQNLKFYNRDKVDGSILSFADIESTIKHVQLMGKDERLFHPCIGQSRDDLILGGLAIFEGIYKAFPNLPVTVTDRGVRDGIVYALAYPERFEPQRHSIML
ncbi:MAG TPA: exopolyphosphatase [Holosporales bacterium]|nr:exopolyphosphatase [Holosporales bacterium]